MIDSATNLIGRTAWRLALALAVLATAARIVQLAVAPTAPAEWLGSSASEPPAASPTYATELAELYTHCPMAAVVDLKTVATSPQHVDALLPPYRTTADRVPAPPIEPAVPRIRYPVSLRPRAAAAPARTDVVRIAQAPATPRPSGEKVGEGAKEPSPSPSLTGRRIEEQDGWLIDPNEWLTPHEQPQPPTAQPDAGPVLGVAADEFVGGVSDADSAPPTEHPSASESPPTDAADRPAPPIVPPAPPTPPAPRPELFAPPADGSPQPVAGVSDAASAPQQNVGGVSDADLPPPAEQQPASQGPATAFDPPLPPPVQQPTAVDPHLELFAKNAYPSARECAQCHEDIYHEWSISAHAYAAVSPMFHKFEQKLNDLSQGTVGYFCMRCHAPVATALGASRAEPLWNLPEVAREGVTCIACHRVQYVYGKSNGERRIEPGDVFAPVFGGIGGDGVAESIHRKEHFKVKTSPDEPGPGQNIHAAGIFFEPLTRSEFCTPCHQVAVYPGIKLEVVWEQYRASPACKKGIQCQDCHMGRVPGLPLGYNTGPVAKMAGKTINDCRKKSNHIFYGPNYPIAHPGVFPFHLKANRWTMDEWLAFDWRAGWGTEAFENRVADGEIQACFPPVWAEADDRYDAREIIDDNFKKLHHKREIRVEIMENGSHVDGPFFDSPLGRGQDVRFHYIITNTNEGHNLLTASLGAQPQFWANVVLIGPDGRRLWETGYTDSIGDLANIHSIDVRHKRVPYDWQLFNLQTMFLITGAKGTDREFFMPVNVDIDQLPFIRPGVQPITTINHPPFIRMESQSLAPLGSRRVPYRIPGELVQQPGTYRLSFRMRNRAEPIYLMRFCGATPDMERSMNEWMIDVHPVTVEFTVR